MIKLALVVGVMGVAMLLLVRGVDLRGGIERVMAWLRAVGPGPFFVGMALLPAIGFPIIVFSLSAGTAFGAQLGMAWVIVWVLLALGINVTLSYWLARYAFRPVLEKFIKRMGYRLPAVAREDHLSLAVLCRITPGPPFFVQSYLLGLAEVPFWTYLWVSWSISSMYGVLVVIFGESLMQGRGKAVIIIVSVLIALTVGVQWMRRRYARQKMGGAS